MRVVVAAVLMIGYCVPCLAEPPVLERLFPTGAQRGTSIDVAVKGKLPGGKAAEGNTGNKPDQSEPGENKQNENMPGENKPDELQFWCSHPGVTWTRGGQENQLRVAVAADAAPGVAYMRLMNAEGVSAVKPFLIGQVPECIEQEPNDLVGQAMVVSQLPQLVHGVLEKRGDVDQVQVAIRAGETLIASVRAERDLQSDVDATLQVVDERGNVLAQNLDYHGLDPHIVWQADRDRSVIVRVFGFPADPNSTIALAGGDNYVYQLTVTTGPWCEGTLPLAVSSSQATTLMPVGWNLGWNVGNSLQPQVVPPQPLVAADRVGDSVGDASYAFWIDGVPGLCMLPVTAAPIWSMPNVAADAADVAAEQTVAPTATATVIELPAVVCGNICQPGQRDVIEFKAVKESKWMVAMESRSLGYPLDAVVTVEQVVPDASGASVSTKLLVEVDDVGRQADSEIEWTVPEDGSYRITVRDVNGAAVDNNLYRLSIRRQQADYRVTVAETAYSGKVGETLEIPISIERKFGFDRPLTISVAGESEGLQAESVVSEAGGETAKEVKLKLTVSQPQVSRFRLAVADESDSVQRIVHDGKYGIGDLWLVVR